MANITVTIKVEEGLKQAATAAFADMGLSLSNGIALYLTRVVATKSIPFPVEVSEYKPSPTFGLEGESYLNHLREAKQSVLNGEYHARELIES